MTAALGYECISGRVADGRGRIGVLPGGGVLSRPRWPTRFKGPSVGDVGGTRGEISGLSGASRRRLMVLLASVDWVGVPGTFVSLTYHLDWGPTWEHWKSDLKALRKRLFRRFPGVLRGVIWRFEFQRRMAPHFHLVLFWHRAPHPVLVQRAVRSAWLEIIGEERNKAAQRHGVQCVPVDSGRGVRRLMLYLGKYIAKSEPGQKFIDPATGEIVMTGRVWGRWGDVPECEPVTLSVSADDYAQLIARIKKQFGGRSWYVDALSPNWAGALILTEPGDLLALTEGLDCEPEAGT